MLTVSVSLWIRRVACMTACAAAAVLLAPAANAAITISAGDHLLLENTPNQQIPILISTDANDQLQNIVLNVQVADTGPGLGGGTIDGPAITAIDAITGTVFDGNNLGDNGSGVIIDQLANSSVITQTGTVTADGLLATVTVDTTGFFASDTNTVFDLFVSSTLNGPTSAIVDTTFVLEDGSLTIVPEPVGMALFGVAGLALVRRRRVA